MIYKTSGISAAALGAALLTTFAGLDSSGANARVTDAQAQTTTDATPLTEEVVPVFVEKEVVQPLPDQGDDGKVETDSTPATPSASLRTLVKTTPVSDTLSDEMQCLAGAIYFEARGEPLEGQLAVAQVIINRADSGVFPSSYCGVVRQPQQFSFVKGGHMPHIRTSSAAWKNARAIAQIAHRGLWDSAADDALYFHARHVRPNWSRTKIALATIDTHIFYR